MQGSGPSLNHPALFAARTPRFNALGYLAHDESLEDVATRLKDQRYRGAICGPAGCGKSIMLQALGDELMQHGLCPLPLRLDPDRHQTLPAKWRRTIRQARPTDALLLDDYDLLPKWARAWVWAASRRVGAVVVAAKGPVHFKTLTSPRPTAALLRDLVQHRISSANLSIDYATLLARCGGNLNEALDIAGRLAQAPAMPNRPSKRRAG